jgi:Replication-relaxation
VVSAARLSRADTRDLRQRLSDRDLAILAQVGELRLMSGRQIEALHFPPQLHATPETGARHCRRVLARLVRDRLLVRLNRRVGGMRAGSQTFIYGLGAVGHRLLQDDGSRLRVYEPGRAFIDHQLAVSQLVVDLTLAAREEQLEIAEVQGEPACWRTLPSIGRAILRPDLFLAVDVGELEYRWFVEVDRGTHHGPSILRKAQLYESYYRSGIEQAEHDVFPRAVWIAPESGRAELLDGSLSGGGFTSGLMVITTSDAAVRVLAGGPA